MNDYDSEYCFISYKSTESRPILSADAETAALAYTSEALPLSSLPLKFKNGAANDKNKHIFSEEPPEILFHGSDIAVKAETFKQLTSIEIPNLALQPAIYIDQNNVHHGNYWFLTFTNKLDCWDRNKSLYAPEPLTSFNDIRYEVISYHLDKATLDSMPLTERRLFKMGATTEGWLLVHNSIASLFKKTGVELVPIKDFGITFFP